MSRALAVALVLAAIALGPQNAAALDKPPDFVPPDEDKIPNFREQTRQVLIELASFAKKRDPNFQVLMRGGAELLVKGEIETRWDEIHDPKGTGFYQRLPLRATFRPLVKLLDGIVADGMYCGTAALPQPLDAMITARRALDADLDREKKQGIHRPPVPVEMGPFSNDPAEELRKAALIRERQMAEERLRRTLYAADALRSEGRMVLGLDVCPDQKAADSALRAGARDKAPVFARVGDDHFDQVPRGHSAFENAAAVTTLSAVRTWLPVLRSDRFGSKDRFVEAVAASNYDMVVVDVAYRGTDFLVKTDIATMKFKALGPRRLVLALMPIGRASDWRWYWKKGWDVGTPGFLFAHDDQPGVFITDMGSAEWKTLLGKTIAGIMDLGFDGVLFDDVGTYLWFEELMPLDG